MSDSFFRDLGLPAPDENLGVGSGTHAEQTARIMLAFEPVLDRHAPDWVVVYGDVNSTVACALVAVKKGIRIAHVEAGLRSRDRSMPEEINRILTDQLADLCSPQPGRRYRLQAGTLPHPDGRNVIVDTAPPRCRAGRAMPRFYGVEGAEYAFVTLHRLQRRRCRYAGRAAPSRIGLGCPCYSPCTRGRGSGSGSSGSRRRMAMSACSIRWATWKRSACSKPLPSC
jgi:hypothetical protein